MIFEFYAQAITSVLGRSVDLAPFWLPPVLIFILWRVWLQYIRAKYISNIDWVTFEFKLPKEITKSPKAMEIVLGNLFAQAYEGPNWARYWLGHVRSWFSLELVATEGKVRFILHAPRYFKEYIESQIYAQYPEVEIMEITDYANTIPYVVPERDWKMWGGEMRLLKEDAYPIKTYMDYDMDKDPKEEHKIDPMTAMLEAMSSTGVGEHLWVQILIMSPRKRFKKEGTWFKMQDWTGQGKELIEQILKDSAAKAQKRITVKVENRFPAMPSLTPGEKDIIEAIERNISKIGFDCGIRVVYLAKKEQFRILNKSAILSSFRQYNSLNLNGFKLGPDVDPKEPWKYSKALTMRLRRRLIDSYRRRSYFYSPYEGKPFVLNTEELATMYHFPGAVATTPTLDRIESKKVEPPVNLPI